jgi:hypothetical protein
MIGFCVVANAANGRAEFLAEGGMAGEIAG